MATAGELYRSGHLGPAIEAASQAVKAAPSDLSARWLLAELLIVQGDHDRADSQLDTIMSLEPGAAATVVPVRHLLRAETARRDFFAAARVPDFLDDGPTPLMRLLLEAFVQLRAGDSHRAGELAMEAERTRPALAGRLGNESFADFRDLDDLASGVFEVLTKTGKYYWIPADRVELLEFTKPERPLDLVWRPVRMVVRDAFDAEVHMPAVYGTLDGADDASRLGRCTDWIGEPPAPVRGVGQRVFLLDGDRETGVMELQTVTFGE
jgi:type VI secretion system protein ImpE